MDAPVSRMQTKKYRFKPKLRKNRKLELRWGTDYYAAVNKAVFINQDTPYVPSEPPELIGTLLDKKETLNACKQCGDCFRFKSSLEDHSTRHSWILGYWCQQCFITRCNHTSNENTKCSSCTTIEASKNAYLNSKGIRKNVRKGVTRVFYNQCQFFQHLKTHGLSQVDLSEVMLMPLPNGIKRENVSKLDRVCKALMEFMFVRRIHIMDWLRDNKIQPEMWQTILNSNSENPKPIADIVRRYAEDCIDVVDSKSIEEAQTEKPVPECDSSRISKSLGKNAKRSRLCTDDGVDLNSSSELSENRDDVPYTATTDIAFVDCGPTPNNCTIETAASEMIDGKRKAATLADIPKVLRSKDSDDGANRTEPDRTNSLLPPFSKQNSSNVKDKLSSSGVSKTAEKKIDISTSAPLNIRNPRILTIRSPKCISLSSIAKLPVDIKKSKNIVIVGNSSKEENKSFAPVSKSAVTNNKLISTVTTPSKLDNHTTSSSSSVDSQSTVSDKSNSKNHSSRGILLNQKNKSAIPIKSVTQSFSEQMSLHGRIVFQNGRKYIIRQIPKSKTQPILPKPLVVTNFVPPTPALSALVPISKAVKVAKPVPVSSPVLLPKPNRPSNRDPKRTRIPSKVMSLSSFNLAAVLSNLNSTHSTTKLTKMQMALIAKLRLSMLNELQTSSKTKIATFTDNLRMISDQYAKAMGIESDEILNSNFDTIQRLEKATNTSMTTTTTTTTLSGTIKEEAPVYTEGGFEKAAKEWESNIKDFKALKNCEVCTKKIKPLMYIIGVSGPASDESQFCQCYNYTCHLCNGNMGSLDKLKAHVKWHNRRKPFTCPDCATVFLSAQQLEVHVWTTCFHPLVRHIYGCNVCEIKGILDMESVAKHFLLLHTRMKLTCSECKYEYTGDPPTYADYANHYVTHHPHIENISEPKRLFVCNLKQCDIRPELFRTHLSDHIGVLEWIYYKCPFCSFASHNVKSGRRLIREHLVDNHLDRLREVVSPNSLPQILENIRTIPRNSMLTLPGNAMSYFGAVGNDTSAEMYTNGPKIVSARSITPASFEHGSVDQSPPDNLKIPRILDVRSEAAEESETEKPKDSIPPTLAVESVAPIVKNEAIESSTIRSESSDVVSRAESITDEGNTSGEETVVVDPATPNVITTTEDSIEANDSFSSSDDTSVSMSQHSETSNSEESSDRGFNTYNLRDGQNDKNEASRMMEEEFRIPRLQSSTPMNAGDRDRPWRIAFDSPGGTNAAPIVYNCHLCGELISTTWSVIQHHFQSRHSTEYKIVAVGPKIPRIPARFLDTGYIDDSSAEKRKPECPVTPAKRRRRWGPKKHFEKPGSPSLGLCVRPEPVQKIEGNFRCKKCDELFKDISVLREHIAATHRIKGQYLICLECGENFVVVPSLQMHLKALHGIQDPITYLSQNTGYAPDTLDDSEAHEKATESNQCYVCMAVFEDKAAVDKHIRVHGMAFLKRKRIEAQKALKNSVKKDESSNDTFDTKNSQDRKPGSGCVISGESGTTAASYPTVARK